MPDIQVIAHRGASAYAPENTFPSFDLALEMGADALETDVRATHDGVLVLCHDASVERISNGHGAVAQLSYAELCRLDVGGWFADRFAGTRIVTAEMFLQHYGRRCPLVLEIKAGDVYMQLAEMVAAAGLMQSVVFTSFELDWLESLHGSIAQARIGYLARSFDDEVIVRTCRLGFEQICPPARALTAAQVEKAHRLGLTVRAWGIDSEETQNMALDAGVDGMTTNWPDRLIARLRALGWRQ